MNRGLKAWVEGSKHEQWLTCANCVKFTEEFGDYGAEDFSKKYLQRG